MNNNKKKSRKRQYSVPYTIISTVILVIFTVIILTPFIITVTKSLEGKGLGNYKRFFSEYNVVPYFINSLIISGITIIIVVSFSLLAAFAFSKLKFRFRMPLFLFLLCALMLPPATILMPVYNIVSALGLMNTRFAVIPPYIALTAPMILLMLKSQMDSIPNEIMEATRIDGCSDWTFFLKMAIPLSKPSIIVSVIWTFINTWNEYLFASTLLQTARYNTITLFPTYVQKDRVKLDEPSRFAAYVVCMLPVLLIYVVLHKHIEKGFIASGSLKG